MTQQEFDNIKERYEKIYILADESMHKLLATMKDDIHTLIKFVDSYQGDHDDPTQVA